MQLWKFLFLANVVRSVILPEDEGDDGQDEDKGVDVSPEKLLRDFDKDEDGQLSLNEFLEKIVTEYEAYTEGDQDAEQGEKVRETAATIFEEADKDSSGMIDIEEFVAWMKEVDEGEDDDEEL
mmetsp:Transcript_53650/g.151113  ORF Transcript_53650/g.151113 Transcript_53650/m.151113 type:complete len:123 (+) Transcript_53650:66-434(+)